MTGSYFIARTLRDYGVTHVFYQDAILRQTLVELEQLGVRRILTHSEKAAAYMADGYARISGRPGVCMAQSVGAANLAAGLQDAYLGRSPVIALTGKKPPLYQQRNAYQEIVHGPLFAPVTKFSAAVDAPAQMPHLLRQAFRVATSGAPGPVHLDLLGHNGRILEAARGDWPVTVDAAHTRYPAHRPRPEPEAIERAAAAIAGAERPVIVAGGGVRISGAQAEVRALVEARGIPLVTSVNGKGTLPDDHPLQFGVVGTYSTRPANQLVYAADLVIYIGSNTGDQVTNNWTVPAPGTRIVQIDIEPEEIGRSYSGTIGVAGDARECVAALLTALGTRPAGAAWLNEAREFLDEWRTEIEPLRHSDAVPIRPERLCKELSDVLPENGVLVADTGYSAIWTATMVHMRHSGQTYLRAAGSLGWALPAALGAKCAVPERPVVCFTGDGGFWYHLSELETARRFGINTVTIVNNNSGLAQGIPDVHKLYSGRPGDETELYAFQPVNFARIAEEMGCLGMRVTQPDEISDTLRAALAANRPVVVEVVTGLECHAPGVWGPGGS